MLISLLIILLLSNAITLRRDKYILFSRLVIIGLVSASFLALTNLFIKPLEKGIGIYVGLFNTALDNSHVFMALLAILTSVIGAAYYLVLVKQIFFYKTDYDKITAIFPDSGLISSNNVKPRQNTVLSFAPCKKVAVKSGSS